MYRAGFAVIPILQVHLDQKIEFRRPLVSPHSFSCCLVGRGECEPPSVLEGDETILNPQPEMTEADSEGETTQVLSPEQTDLTDGESTEETQAIQFLDDFDHDFFDTEPTSS